jgi:diguanylate cyclase (GGDEF)-like protein
VELVQDLARRIAARHRGRVRGRPGQPVDAVDVPDPAGAGPGRPLVIAVRIVGFTGYPTTERNRLHHRLRSIVEGIANDSGAELSDLTSIGDGAQLTLRSATPGPAGLLTALTAALSTANEGTGPAPRLRVRAAMYLADDTALSDRPVLDAPELRRALRNAPAADLAMVVSDAVHATVAEAEPAWIALLPAEAVTTRHRDPLTGLRNRAWLTEHGDAELATAAPGRAALMLVDLNEFRSVNEQLGHAAGDRILTDIAHRFAVRLTATEWLMRLGGDEFAVLMTDLEPGTVSQRARELLAVLERSVRVGKKSRHLTASAGVAVNEPPVDIAELWRRADTAMYAAKQQAADIVVFGPDLAARLALHAMTGDVADALDRDEFELRLQPIVDLRDGTVVAVEALTWWRHPRRGLLRPGQFLDAVDGSRVAGAFAAAALADALQFAAVCSRAGLHLRLHVNVPSGALLDGRFADTIQARLSVSDVAPSRLVLEVGVQEASDVAGVSTVLRRLRTLGVGVLVDAFGAGFTSMTQLRQAPVSALKIDAAYTGEPELTIARNMIDVGRTLGLQVMADGVTTGEQRAGLLAAGCHLGQGTLFADAHPADQTLALLRRHRRPEAGGTVARLPA